MLKLWDVLNYFLYYFVCFILLQRKGFLSCQKYLQKFNSNRKKLLDSDVVKIVNSEVF